MLKKPSFVILGDGSWGTTLAMLLSSKGFPVALWSAFPEYARQINISRENKKFLPGIKIPLAIKITHELGEAVKASEIVIVAIPSEYLRPIIRRLKPLNLKGKILLSVVKGLEDRTHMRMSEVIRQELGAMPVAVLSGPTIAREVVKGIPTTAVIASTHQTVASRLQALFMTPRFRVYTNSDVVGVELGGSLKNVIAIACGICDGLGFGTNAKAALLTRGLAEITRLGVAMGARAATFSGLSGLGDLVTTCTSPFSRNRFVGEHIGKGCTLKQVAAKMVMVAEGIHTSRVVYQLSRSYHIEMPISHQVYLVLHRQKPPLRAVEELMGRAGRAE